MVVTASTEPGSEQALGEGQPSLSSAPTSCCGPGLGLRGLSAWRVGGASRPGDPEL